MQEADQWVGVYYPHEMMASSRSRAITCLLFDRIVLHFPVADMACGGGHGWSEDVLGDSQLVKAGILEAREEILLPDVEVDFSPGHFWGTPDEFNEFVQLQITSMAFSRIARVKFVEMIFRTVIGWITIGKTVRRY